VQRRFSLLVAPVLLLALFASACGSNGSAASDSLGVGRKAGAEEIGTPQDLTRVTLRVADQARSVELPLVASGELDTAPYKTTFATFANGPAVVEAIRAGDIDVGTLGDVPALGALQGGVDVKVVGVTSSTGPGSLLIARPESGIKTAADLKGKKVAFTTGTAQHGFALRVLRTAGLKQSDVQQVDVPLQDLPSVLESGDADASVISVEAKIKYFKAHPGAVQVAAAKDLKPNVGGFFLAAAKALADPGKRAAIDDFVARRVRAFTWVQGHPDQWADTYYVKERKQRPEDAREILDETGYSQFVPIGPDIADAHQDLADLLRATGAFPKQIDVSPLYDPQTISRLNAVVSKELPK
jgi:sulfonate transport system substrate-binding protein